MTTTATPADPFPRRRGAAVASPPPATTAPAAGGVRLARAARRRAAIAALTVAAALVAAPPAAAQTVPPDPCGGAPRLTTTGAAEVRVPADGATVAIRVETVRPRPAAASSAMTEKLEAVLAALSAAGGEARATTGYSLETVSNYETGEIAGYRAVSGVELKVDDLSRLSALLEAALAGGATDVTSLTFTSAEERQAHDRALAAAYRQAAADADVLAAASGHRLGDLVELTTEPRSMRAYTSEEIVVTGTVPSFEMPRVVAHAGVLAEWCLVPR